MLHKQLNDLPDELLQLIFARLNIKTLREIAMTSKRMQALAKPYAQTAWRNQIKEDFGDRATGLQFCVPEQYQVYHAVLSLAKKVKILCKKPFSSKVTEADKHLQRNMEYGDPRRYKLGTGFGGIRIWAVQKLESKQLFDTMLNKFPENLEKYHDLMRKFSSEDAFLAFAELHEPYEIVKDMLKFNVDVNATRYGGRTALMEVVHQGLGGRYTDRLFSPQKMILVLLQAGVDVNLQDKFGFTALLWLIRNYGISVAEKIELAKLLLMAGADISITLNSDSLFVPCRTIFDLARDEHQLPESSNAELLDFLRNARQFQIEYFSQQLVTGSVADVKDIINKQQAAGITKAQIRDHILQANGVDDATQKRILECALEKDASGNPANALALYMETYQVAQESGTSSSVKKWFAKSVADYTYTSGSIFFRRDTETVQIIQQRLNELQSANEEMDRPGSPNDIPLLVRQYSHPGVASNSSSQTASASSGSSLTVSAARKTN